MFLIRNSDGVELPQDQRQSARQCKLRDNRCPYNQGMIMQFTAVLTSAEEGGFVAMNPETGTTTQGESIEEAIANLKEATALYLDEFPQSSTGHPLITVFSLPEPLHA